MSRRDASARASSTSRRPTSAWRCCSARSSQAFADAGYEVIGASAPGRYVDELERRGIRHVPLEHATRSMARTATPRRCSSCARCSAASRPTSCTRTTRSRASTAGSRPRWRRVPAVVNTVHGLYALPEDPLGEARRRLRARTARGDVLRRRAAAEPRGPRRAARLGVPRAQAARARQRHRPHALRSRSDRRLAVAAATAEPRAPAPSDIVCGVVGRLVWEKGYREVFDAAARLRDARTERPVRRRRPVRAGEGGRAHRRRHPPGRARRRHHVPRHARRRRRPLRGDGPLRAGVVPRGFPALGDGSRGDGPARRRHRHPRLPPGGRRRRAPGMLVPSRDAARARRRRSRRSPATPTLRVRDGRGGTRQGAARVRPAACDRHHARRLRAAPAAARPAAAA